jgi:mRNA interferase MazF
MTKGDIVLVPFPFTDLSGIKNRPAVVLVSNEMDVVVAFVTTQTKWQEKWDVIIEPTISNGLKISSLLRLSKLATLDKTLVIGRLGSLSAEDLVILDDNLVELLQIQR